MNRVIFPLLFIVLQLLTSCGGHDYTVKGTVADSALEGDTLYLKSYNLETNEAKVLDSTIVEGLCFNFKGQASDSLGYLSIYSRDHRMEPGLFMVEDGSITFKIDSFDATRATYKTSVAGTPQNDQFQAFQCRRDSLLYIILDLNKKLEELRKNGKLEDVDVRTLNDRFKIILEEYEKCIEGFVVTHAENPISAKIFLDEMYTLHLLSLKKAFSAISTQYIRPSVYDRVKKNLNAMEATAVGKKFTDVKGKTMNGVDIAFSDIIGKGSVVLVDFWASWCTPCRELIPELQDLFQRYKSKGLKVISVSLDDNLEQWRKATKAEKITWPQLSNLKGWEEPAASIYGISTIPQLILFDKDGTILARDPNLTDLELLLREKL